MQASPNAAEQDEDLAAAPEGMRASPGAAGQGSPGAEFPGSVSEFVHEGRVQYMQLARNTEFVREGDRSARKYGRVGEELREGRVKYTPISTQQVGSHRSTRQCGPYLHLLSIFSVYVKAACSSCK
jgi:hypothetical protein